MGMTLISPTDVIIAQLNDLLGIKEEELKIVTAEAVLHRSIPFLTCVHDQLSDTRSNLARLRQEVPCMTLRGFCDASKATTHNRK